MADTLSYLFGWGLILSLACYVALYVTARYVLHKTAGQTQEISYPLLVAFIFFFFLFVSTAIWDDTESSLASQIGYELLFVAVTLACAIPICPKKIQDPLAWVFGALLVASATIIALDEQTVNAAYGLAFGALAGIGIAMGSILYYGTWRRFKAQGFARARTPEEVLTETRYLNAHEGKHPSFLYFTPGVIYGLIALQLFLGIIISVDFSFGMAATMSWMVSLVASFYLFSRISDWRLRRLK